MASRAIEAEIDNLYRLPLEEFTPARNALAKKAGGDAARIKSLTKPPVAAWAVNQLHWKDRGTWDELIAASAEARRAHKAVLAGKSGDVRAAGKVHEDAVDKALKRTLALLTESGHPATDTTRQAVATTLRALPADEPPGRLTRVLQPGGFEMLSGLSIAAGSRVAHLPKPAHPAPAARKATPEKPKVDPKVLTRARQAVAAAERELREAETAARRAEFDKAKAEREAARARKEAEQAEETLSRATDQIGKTEKAIEKAREQLDEVRSKLEDIENGT